MEEKWRYDADAGLVIGGAGLPDSIAGDASSEDPRLIVDDYEHNAFVVRKNLLAEEDFSILLRTDDSMRQRAELAYDQRKEVERQFALEAMQRAAVVRREMAARAPPPVPTPTPGTPGATPRTPVAVGANAAAMDPIVAAQLRKMQASRGQIGANQVPQRPHPLAIGTAATASTPSQASPPPSSSESGPSPSLANGLPVVNGLGANGQARVPNGIAVPTPPPTQPSFPNQLQPPTVARPSQSPNMSDASAIQTSPTSPVVRPKSQQSLPQVNGAGHVPVPMSLGQQQSLTNHTPTFPQTNGNLMANFPNGFNAGLIPGAASAQLRAANGLTNGSVVQQQMMLNGLAGMSAAGLSSQQAMGLKNAFGAVNGTQNGMSPPQQLPSHIQAQQQAALQAQLQVNGMAGGLSIGGLNGMGPGPGGMMLGGSLANGNIALKLPPQRMMQWAAATQKENAINVPAQPSSSPVPTSMSPVNGQRLISGVNRGSPHLQAGVIAGRASPAQMAGIHHHAANGTSSSPHIPHAPSPLAAHQQTVQGHMNGF
ncbi:hypothetical protein FRC01_002584 [Tulasnella sp. 417]|nr:hypothetical protein FRC01_002584 [Tulasnella sp. 417]